MRVERDPRPQTDNALNALMSSPHISQAGVSGTKAACLALPRL